MGFPVAKKWAFSFGLLPYTTMSYKATDTLQTSSLGNVTYQHQGTGGVNRFYIGNAFKLYKDSVRYLSVGFNVNYLFGVVNQQQRVVYDVPRALNAKIIDEHTYRGFTTNFGIQMQQKIKDKYALTLGGVYSPNNTIKDERTITGQRFTRETDLISNAVTEYVFDTLTLRTETNKVTVPGSMGVGATFGFLNGVNVIERLKISVDYTISNWSKYNSVKTSTISFVNASKTAIGIQYMPQGGKGFINNIQYRLGAYSGNYFIAVNGAKVNDMGLTGGLGLPFKRISSTINIGFNVGQRSMASTLIKENYYNLLVNFTLNDIWFIKPKVD